MNKPDIKIFYKVFIDYIINRLKSNSIIEIAEDSDKYNRYVFKIYPNVIITWTNTNKFWMFNNNITILIEQEFFKELGENLKKYQIDTIPQDLYNQKNLHFKHLSVWNKLVLKYYLNQRLKKKYVTKFKRELSSFFKNYLDDSRKINNIDDLK